MRRLHRSVLAVAIVAALFVGGTFGATSFNARPVSADAICGQWATWNGYMCVPFSSYNYGNNNYYGNYGNYGYYNNYNTCLYWWSCQQVQNPYYQYPYYQYPIAQSYYNPYPVYQAPISSGYSCSTGAIANLLGGNYICWYY